MKVTQIANSSDIEFLRLLQQSDLQLTDELRSAIITRTYTLEVKLERVLGVLDDLEHAIGQVTGSIRGEQ